MGHDGLLPPFIEPTGPRVPDAAVVQAFARAEPAGHSARLHTEGSGLLADRVEVVALRLAPGAVIVRVDVSDEAAPLLPMIEAALTEGGLERLDESTLLGVPVALQLVGLRLSEWDLWGDDIDGAFAALRTIARG